MELLFLCYESCLTSCLDTSNILTQYSGVWNISHQHREISRSSLLCNAKCPENYRPCYAARFLVVDLFRMFVPYGWYLNVCDIRWCWFTKKRSCTKNIWICGPPKVWQVQETGKWWPIMINQSNWVFFPTFALAFWGGVKQQTCDLINQCRISTKMDTQPARMTF